MTNKISSVVAWNVNSINARLERVISFLEKKQPDVVCMQETKCLPEKFPWQEIEDLGYAAHVKGQKTFNGVAVLYKKNFQSEAHDIEISVGEFGAQPRIQACSVEDWDIWSVYVPNGKEVGDEKYHFKLEWLKQLNQHVREHKKTQRPLLICGDFNIAPTNLDVYNPEEWGEESILCSPPERKLFSELLEQGFVDLLRHKKPNEQIFSWWDYRALGFPLNKGLRIDFVLATASLAESCSDVYVDRDERKGKKPSDHAPVWATF